LSLRDKFEKKEIEEFEEIEESEECTYQCIECLKEEIVQEYAEMILDAEDREEIEYLLDNEDLN
jgi:hypothetical protein